MLKFNRYYAVCSPFVLHASFSKVTTTLLQTHNSSRLQGIRNIACRLGTTGLVPGHAQSFQRGTLDRPRNQIPVPLLFHLHVLKMQLDQRT